MMTGNYLLSEENIALCMFFALLVSLASTLEKAAAVKAAATKTTTTTTTMTTTKTPDGGQEEATVQQEQGKSTQQVIFFLSFVFFHGIVNVFMTLILPPLGPVSLYWPTYVAGKLLLNVIIIGIIMRFEPITKTVQVATMVITCAVLFIPLVGPTTTSTDATTYNNNPVEDLLKLNNVIGFIWICILLIIFLISAGIMILANLQKIPHGTFKETILFNVYVGASVLGGAAAKASTYFIEQANNSIDGSDTTSNTVMAGRVIFQIISWTFLVIWMYEAYMEACHVRSLARFVPLTQFGSLFFNAITGILVWDEGSTIQSWTGYTLVYLLIILGLYLLSDLDVFAASSVDLQTTIHNDDDDKDYKTDKAPTKLHIMDGNSDGIMTAILPDTATVTTPTEETASTWTNKNMTMPSNMEEYNNVGDHDVVIGRRRQSNYRFQRRRNLSMSSRSSLTGTGGTSAFASRESSSLFWVQAPSMIMVAAHQQQQNGQDEEEDFNGTHKSNTDSNDADINNVENQRKRSSNCYRYSTRRSRRSSTTMDDLLHLTDVIASSSSFLVPTPAPPLSYNSERQQRQGSDEEESDTTEDCTVV